MVQRNVLDGETAPPGAPLSSAPVSLKRVPACPTSPSCWEDQRGNWM